MTRKALEPPSIGVQVLYVAGPFFALSAIPFALGYWERDHRVSGLLSFSLLLMDGAVALILLGRIVARLRGACAALGSRRALLLNVLCVFGVLLALPPISGARATGRCAWELSVLLPRVAKLQELNDGRPRYLQSVTVDGYVFEHIAVHSDGMTIQTVETPGGVLDTAVPRGLFLARTPASVGAFFQRFTYLEAETLSPGIYWWYYCEP